MKCTKCQVKISKGEKREYNQEVLCEDCYIDVLSPAKFCDPWADYSAKSFVEKNPNCALSQNQILIMGTIKDNGEVDPLFLMEKLKDKISPEVGELETAALHRMGKIIIEHNNGNVVIKLP